MADSIMSKDLFMGSGAGALDAVFLYMGILDAYEAVGTELIGPNVLEEHVLPRMVYYVREFLPEIFSERSDADELVNELDQFLKYFSQKVDDARTQGSAHQLIMEDIWKLRAAIFGYESVFIKILGEAAIKNYMFTRVADILSAYLPVKYARVSVGRDGITVATNKCEFSRIHDSDAYRSLHVRFCPWGMIASAIVAAHEGRETNLESSTFTISGSVSKIVSKGGE
jgi:hypothetical protein